MRKAAGARRVPGFAGAAFGPVLLAVVLELVSPARPAAAATFERVEGHLTIALSAAPERPREGDRVRYTVRIVDALGRPSDRAKVRLTAAMTDGMVIRADLAPASDPGIYAGTLLFTMAARWEVELSIRDPAGSIRTVFDEVVAPR